MCLSYKHDPQTTKAILPRQPFYAYKWVVRKDHQLVSPTFYFVWRPGTLEAKMTDSHAGFYLFVTKPGLRLTSGGKVLLRVLVDPADVTMSGPDSHGGVTGTCVLAKKCVITKADYKAAYDGKTTEYTTKEVAAAKATTKVLKKKAAANKVAEKKKIAAVKKKADAVVKRAKKKATKKKVTKKKVAAKKSTKRVAKKSSVNDELTTSALKTMAKVVKLPGYTRMSRPELIKALAKRLKS